MPDDKSLCDAYATSQALPALNDRLALRLEKLAGLVSRSGPLPPGPVLLWKDKTRTIRHKQIGKELFVGRRVENDGIRLPDDEFLGRRHFVIRNLGEECVLEDLASVNGTAVNETDNRVKKRLLLDGDMIFAGCHIFAFLYQRAPAPQKS